MIVQDIVNAMLYRYFPLLLALCAAGITSFTVSAKSEVIVPVIDVATGQLYGSVSGNTWLSAIDTQKSVKDSLMLNAYSSDGKLLQKTTVSATQTSEICLSPTFRSKMPLPTNAVTLVGSRRNAALRKPEALDKNNPVYREAVALWLRERGIDESYPMLSQLWRIDLEGDGRDEVLIAATRHRGSETSTQAGDYSLLLLRKLKGEAVVTIPVFSEIFLETCIAECALQRYEVINLLDIDNDGKLEIITKSVGYESITQTIFSVEGLELKKRLEWSCGS